MNRRTAWIRTILVLTIGGGLIVGGITYSLRALQNGHRLFGNNSSCAVEVGDKTFDLDPEQMANASTIVGVARRRELPERAAVIALATARQESQLYNLNYGDRDSLGLFQQRPSQGWGSPAQTQDPQYATNKFFEALERVDGYQDLELTVAAQRVQRSGFPDAYAKHETEAQALAAALLGKTPASLSCTVDKKAPRPGELAAVERALAAEQPAVRSTKIGRSGIRLQPSNSVDSWALAQWAVGSADRLGIMGVYTGDAHWTRTASAKGWQSNPAASGSEVFIMLDGSRPSPSPSSLAAPGPAASR